MTEYSGKIYEYLKSLYNFKVYRYNERSLIIYFCTFLLILGGHYVSIWGINALKIGFVNTVPQYWTKWLHDAVRKCAEYGITVNIHDAYRTTGFSRTYPNLLTQEGIRGNEHMTTARHNTSYSCKTKK
jgi:hypothetical protein